MKCEEPKVNTWKMVVIGFAILLLQTTATAQTYIVAHRCNTGSWATNAVQKHGVNAIEADFMYGRPTAFVEKDWYLAHDNVLAGAVKLDTWLADVSKVASSFAILHVDIKSPDGPLDKLYDRLRDKLPGVGLIFDIGAVKNGPHLAKIKERILKDNFAVAAMGFDDSPTAVNTFFKNEGYPRDKYWYEIGLAAGFVWSKKEEDWTREAIKARNAGTGPKVVIWTFEKESTVKAWLNEGVDAILVNSSACFGLAGAGAADADVHVKNAKQGRYGLPGRNPFALNNNATAPKPASNNSQPVVTSPAERAITFKNEAGYVAKLTVVYFVTETIAGGAQVPMAKSLSTSAISLGVTRSLVVPRNTVKGMPISVVIEGIGTTKSKVLETTVPEGFNGTLCFKSWGTIFDAKGGTCQ